VREQGLKTRIFRHHMVLELVFFRPFGPQERRWPTATMRDRVIVTQSQSRRLNRAYSDAEMTKIAAVETHTPDAWPKPGYGMFWP
jgi:hypothetical protein